MPLTITIFKLRTICSPQYLQSALPYSFPCGKMDSNTFTVYGSHFKGLKFIVANIILLKLATQHIQSLSVCCLQNGFRSSLQESKTSKSFPKLHKFLWLKPSTHSSKLNYQRSRISGQFCNGIGRDKKQLFYKSWPIRLTPRLSQGIFEVKFPTRAYPPVTKCEIMALYQPKLLRSLYLENIFQCIVMYTQ